MHPDVSRARRRAHDRHHKLGALILLRTGGTHVAPVIDAARTVVTQAGVADVEMVMVDGRIVKRDGRLVCDQQGSSPGTPRIAGHERRAWQGLRPATGTVDGAGLTAVSAAHFLLPGDG
jgi:hypothetical protein